MIETFNLLIYFLFERTLKSKTIFHERVYLGSVLLGVKNNFKIEMIKGKCKLNIRSLRLRCFSNVFLTNNILTIHRNIAGYQRGRIKSDLQKFFEAKVTACFPVPPNPYRERPWVQCRSGWCWRHPGGSWRCCSNHRPRRKELTGLEFELQMWNHALQDKKHCHFVEIEY